MGYGNRMLCQRIVTNKIFSKQGYQYIKTNLRTYVIVSTENVYLITVVNNLISYFTCLWNVIA